MPVTRFNALLHGSSRYSTRTSRSIERMFANRGRAGRARQIRDLYWPRQRGRRLPAEYPRPEGRGVTLFLELVAVAALILLNGFFVAAEYGLVTARRTKIAELEQAGNRRARAVKTIVADPPRFIAAMQLGVTLSSLGIGAVGEPVLTHVFDPVLATVLAVILAFLIITFFHVVIGELVPKGLALRHSERVALAVSAPVRGFFVLFNPLILILQRATEVVLRGLGTEPPRPEERVLSEP